MNNPEQRIVVIVLLSLTAVGWTCLDVCGAPPGFSSEQTISERMQVRLIKNALIALNQANVTGNYTVLRDLCSPELREKQKAADFALEFHSTHDRNRDMSFVMEMKPSLSQPPVFSADGRMRLVGYFPTRPLKLNYDLVFLKTVRGDWWIDGIVICTEPVATPTERWPVGFTVEPPAVRK